MFDKFKQLLAGGGQPRPTPRPGASGARAGSAARRAPARRAPLERMDAFAATPPPAEQSCPNCGQPMLAGWGATCGKCRPNMVAPKTMFVSLDKSARAALSGAQAAGMALGWLVVLRSPDARQNGALIELSDPRVVLSRAGGGVASGVRVIGFEDEFMSSAHAVLIRPDRADRNGAFSIRDRQDPGPSANGTFVNSHKVGPGEVLRLSDGDSIRVGTTELLLKTLWLPSPPSGAI